MAFHKVQTVGEIHVVHNWSVADTTARDAIVVAAADIGKIARITGTNEFHVLVNNTGPVWKNITQTVGTDMNTVTALTPSAGVLTIDCALGDYFTLALGANVTSIVFTNLPAAGKGTSKFIRINQSGSFTMAWPASFRWEGVAPSISAVAAIDLLALSSFDQGTKWDATLSKGRV